MYFLVSAVPNSLQIKMGTTITNKPRDGFCNVLEPFLLITVDIYNLRVGEGILLNRDLPDLWTVSVLNLHQQTFILKAQVIEIKDKPSYPIGESCIDAFGHLPVYTDRGIRKRAILAVGRQDFGMHDKLIPLLDGVEIIGSSSDHLIIDTENCKEKINVGDILEFDIYYAPCYI